MAGMIAGCITVTGLASKLISGVIAISSAIPNPTLSLMLALFLTMLCCIVLGMGVPTTANYCIMASPCAPILITLGIPKVAAHFFVFYFGIVADITPPVALAAYAGSAIAKSDPMKTGINATKLAIAAFIVPYIFAMNPSMLLMDQGVLAAIQVIITSCLGIFGIAAALEGYIVTRAPWWRAADRPAQAQQARRRVKKPEPFARMHVRVSDVHLFARRAPPGPGVYTRGPAAYNIPVRRFGKERSA